MGHVLQPEGKEPHQIEQRGRRQGNLANVFYCLPEKVFEGNKDEAGSKADHPQTEAVGGQDVEDEKIRVEEPCFRHEGQRCKKKDPGSAGDFRKNAPKGVFRFVFQVNQQR